MDTPIPDASARPDDLVGVIDCADSCAIPEGRALRRVPPSRHAWSDVLRCPTCGDCFLVIPADAMMKARQK